MPKIVCPHCQMAFDEEGAERIGADQVKLGINAPSEVPVHREEIYYKILKEDNSPTKGRTLRLARRKDR